jgi:PKD repeat protein
LGIKKYLLPIVLLALLFLPLTAAATGDVKINDFTASVTSGNVPLHVYFTGNVTGTVTNWHWKFTNEQTGLTTTSTANVTAVHNFLKPGVFDVQLNVVGPGGNDTLLKKAYITANAPK